ncbi:YjgB family protein [Virgibacillus oceani]|uniref:DUF4309 domain-containing protein n=1 Tax=Virgibacillus oceani TaxID=1479511 RepID=A0A917HHD6_9BACI|nr:YjgB family protein [Virgibacillus oceani]GGG79040.1 hypothetical protein GCM10011398_25410 [Virgibacillus oceani]
MAFNKTASKLIAVSLITGLVFGMGSLSHTGQVHAESGAAVTSSAANQNAVDTLTNLYDHAFSGEMPGNIQGLKINDSTKKAVHQKLGSPHEVNNQFDLYGWNMGNPGYGFAYNNDNTISEIRNFGTGVERQTNLGGITPDLLANELGHADKVLDVPMTDETDYVYRTGDYELHFIVGDNPIIEGYDKTVNHVNLKEAK